MGKVAEMRVIVGDKKDPDLAEGMRILEALLFAAEAPLDGLCHTDLPLSYQYSNWFVIDLHGSG